MAFAVTCRAESRDTYLIGVIGALSVLALAWSFAEVTRTLRA
jgi:hypothetical protein